MTAVAIPLTHRNGWSQHGLNNMSAEARTCVPRKSAQRSNSSSSIPSSASSASSSTTSTAPSSSNGGPGGDVTHNGAARKKLGRAAWASSTKTEPTVGIANARSQSMSGTGSSNVALGNSHPASSQGSQSQNLASHGGSTKSVQLGDSTTLLQLQPLNGTFERKAVAIPHAPDVLRIGRQTNQKTLPTPTNGYFDSKVLSRQHAEIWSDRDGRVSIRDVGSSNGTFVNGKRLSLENKPSETERLKEGDILELGIDIVSEDQKSVVHHKVAARVDYAGLQAAVGGDPSSVASDFEFVSSFNTQQARGRSTSQSSNGDGRLTTAALSNVPTPYHAKWLQPVTMEQIVKRLNNELKQARSHSINIHSRTSVAGAMIEDLKSHGDSDMPLEARGKSVEDTNVHFFSAPPAPPPSQPLPEAPGNSRSRSGMVDDIEMPPVLRRSATAKPKLTQMPTNASLPSLQPEQGHQVLQLAEALSTAQKEIAAQSQRLKELEDDLTLERRNRRSIEEKLSELEASNTSPSKPAGVVDMTTYALPGHTLQGSDLAQRIQVMKGEVDEMKIVMAQYKRRAEVAEEDCRRDRQTLEEMIESVGRREAAASRKQQRRSRKVAASGSAEPAADIEVRAIDDELLGQIRRARDRLQVRPRFSKTTATDASGGCSMSITELQLLGKAALAATIERGPHDNDLNRQQHVEVLDGQDGQAGGIGNKRQDQLAQSAPYASLIGVVLLGMGLMTYLNGWQRVTDR